MPNDLRLKVAASSIDGRGIAKLDSDSFRKLKLEEGMSILVTYGTKTLELAVKQDSVFSECTVRLMKADMAQLRVEEGMEATVIKKNGAKPEKGKGKAKKGKKGKKANAASLDSF